ncbi:MAG: phytanoyl-CoA dioxygenase family protein [Alphaproteobacteria bacterium]
MIELKTPRGLPVNVPEIEAEDPSPKFSSDESGNIGDYYNENGYVVIKSLYSNKQCSEIIKLWNEEIKIFDGYIYRQATAKAERHVKNGNGWVMNPILNPQSVSPKHFPQFRKYATDGILCDIKLSKVFSGILGDAPKIVQSMYFEGNSATWEHQDSYYLDSETIGEMSAAWIALENITARAGRFFVCPKSHKIQLENHSLSNNIAENHEDYISSVVKKIKDEKLPIRAPILNQGDVLLWNSRTIHGSLDSQDAKKSRSSMTCHAIPNKRKFLQMQSRTLDLVTEKINETYIFRPKNLARFKNRVIFKLETNFPSLFYYLKRKAIIFLLKNKTG